MNELDEVEGLIKEAVMSLDKAVKSVVELRDISRARGYPEDEILEEMKKGFTGYHRPRGYRKDLEKGEMKEIQIDAANKSCSM
jgi:hypothetical protein